MIFKYRTWRTKALDEVILQFGRQLCHKYPWQTLIAYYVNLHSNSYEHISDLRAEAIREKL